jgi:cardiolipin synthase
MRNSLIHQRWDEEALLFDGDAYFPELITAIDLANHSVELETYIFETDLIGCEIELALIRAAARGLKVRLLVDGIGSLGWISSRLLIVAKEGVEIRVYHPVRHFLFSRQWSKINRRTHRKMCLIDDQTAFVGSINIAQCHSQKTIGPNAWRDTGVKVKGPGLIDLKNAFEHAWARARGANGQRHWIETLKLLPTWRPKSVLVRLNYTRRIRRRSFRAFLARIRGAKKRIFVTNAYLAPSHPVIRALTRAARRGVDVRILVPQKSDVFFMPWVATSYYRRLLKAGVRIYEFRPRFLHAKSVIIDNWAVVGTSNLNSRSLLHDLEVDIVLSRATTIETLREKFEDDLSHAEEISRAPSGLQAWLGRAIIRLFRHWI